MYLHELKIGNVTLKNNILLAPMAGITDLPFRLICEKFSVGLTCTEMVSSKAIFYDDTKTKKLLNLEGEKRPVSIQLFGSDLEALKYSTKYVSEMADIVDINMGCPAPKVTKNGDGSSLLKSLSKAKQVISAVVNNSSKPVTLKIRLGWDKENIVSTEIAKIAEDCGISAITVHGRTKTDYYSGNINFEEIKKVKEAVKIPVIGNGNIVDEKTALEMFEKTGCDGIMIGRGAIGNPWIFEKIIYYLQNNKKQEEVSLEEKFKIVNEHFLLEIKEKGEYTGIREFRKHISAYTKSLPNSSSFRDRINKIDEKEEFERVINEYYNLILSER